VDAQTTQQGEHAGTGAAQVVVGIDPGAAEVADGFVGFVGDAHGGEFTGAVETGELAGVLLVGFDLVAGLGRDQRRGDDGAGHAGFGEVPGDPHAASAGLVAHMDVTRRNLVSFGDAPHDPFEGVVGGGD